MEEQEQPQIQAASCHHPYAAPYRLETWTTIQTDEKRHDVLDSRCLCRTLIIKVKWFHRVKNTEIRRRAGHDSASRVEGLAMCAEWAHPASLKHYLSGAQRTSEESAGVADAVLDGVIPFYVGIDDWRGGGNLSGGQFKMEECVCTIGIMMPYLSIRRRKQILVLQLDKIKLANCQYNWKPLSYLSLKKYTSFQPSRGSSFIYCYKL